MTDRTDPKPSSMVTWCAAHPLLWSSVIAVAMILIGFRAGLSFLTNLAGAAVFATVNALIWILWGKRIAAWHSVVTPRPRGFDPSPIPQSAKPRLWAVGAVLVAVTFGLLTIVAATRSVVLEWVVVSIVGVPVVALIVTRGAASRPRSLRLPRRLSWEFLVTGTTAIAGALLVAFLTDSDSWIVWYWVGPVFIAVAYVRERSDAS